MYSTRLAMRNETIKSRLIYCRFFHTTAVLFVINEVRRLYIYMCACEISTTWNAWNNRAHVCGNDIPTYKTAVCYTRLHNTWRRKKLGSKYDYIYDTDVNELLKNDLNNRELG